MRSLKFDIPAEAPIEGRHGPVADESGHPGWRYVETRGGLGGTYNHAVADQQRQHMAD